MQLNLDKFDKQKGKSTFKHPKSNLRTLIKDQGNLPPDALYGLVTAVLGRTYLVEKLSDDLSDNQVYLCTAGGTIISDHRFTNIVAVGDKVYFQAKKRKDKEGTGVIIKVEQRKNVLSRNSVGIESREHVLASNIDNLIIFMSANEPYYNKKLIDRFLVTAELNSIAPIICINKIELMELDYIQEDLEIYNELDIPLFLLSVRNNIGVREVVDYIKDSYSVLAGPSGVGKSTFLNSLIGNEYQNVQEISARTNKGQHTTSAARMFKIPNTFEFEEMPKGRLIDTPGIREFGIFGIEKKELGLYYHDFDEYASKCKFAPCTHIHEPNCNVVQAVDDGLISVERYESYINIFVSLDK
jgi:ribosome biogenesis GTPase